MTNLTIRRYHGDQPACWTDSIFQVDQCAAWSPNCSTSIKAARIGLTTQGHARPSPHSPELILNNFQTLLGLSVGRLFGSLFPPLPQFRGRQVVTLHNQRDFLFFRRHR